jgi:hypothetical protein
MLAMTIGSPAAAAPRTSAGAKTVAATPLFNNALRLIPMITPLLFVVVFRSSAAAHFSPRCSADPEPVKHVMIQSTDSNDSAAVGVHACLELPKYGLWLPIELSPRPAIAWTAGPSCRPRSAMTSDRRLRVPKGTLERRPQTRSSSQSRMRDDRKPDQRRTSVCGAWPNVFLNARLK